MAKKKTSGRRRTYSGNSPIPKKLKKGAQVYDYSPSADLKNKEKLKKAIFQCFADNDTDSLREIMKGYLMAINKAKFLKKAKIKERTLYRALEPGSNLTLNNFMKITSAIF